MSQIIFNGVQVTGIAAAVPENSRSIEDDFALFGQEDVLKVSSSIGVRKRHVSDKLCTSDLCCAAAERLLSEIGCHAKEVDALVFLSQSADYPLPATSCILQHRLGLENVCAAFDMNLGCSGYVYGLWVVSSLIASGAAKKALLLVGDMSYSSCSPQDRTVALLFGDAGSATLLEASPGAGQSCYILGTDGSGKDHLIIKHGGQRHRWQPDSRIRVSCSDGNVRAPSDLYVNGAEIFSFTLTKVPPLVKETLKLAGKSTEDINAFVFHQANTLLLEHLRKKLNIPIEKMIFGMEHFGNTSSASIPLAMVTELSEQLREGTVDLLLAGFGVGLSWAAVNIICDRITISDLIYVPESAAQV